MPTKIKHPTNIEIFDGTSHPSARRHVRTGITITIPAIVSGARNFGHDSEMMEEASHESSDSPPAAEPMAPEDLGDEDGSSEA
ncbi:hypothetical protein E4U23_006282 [Claviceps purpurea]|nr:hypothetical protein E4U23_006282 [Claviceps purpurea]